MVGLTLLALSGGLVLAARRHRDFNAAAAILAIGGVVASPHALPSDLVLVAVGLAIWGEAGWIDWLAFSGVALVPAPAPPPTPAAARPALMLLLALWLLLFPCGTGPPPVPWCRRSIPTLT